MDILADNASRAIAWCNHRDVPVVNGEHNFGDRVSGELVGVKIHGVDGVGNLDLPAVPQAQRDARSHGYVDAAAFIVEKCNESPGDITLVTLGPLTNIARALALDPGLAGKVRQVVMMAGSFCGRGNITPAAEANIHNDPEAAQAVFTMFPDVVVAPLDVTRQLELRRLLSSVTDCPAKKFLHDSSVHYIKALTGLGATMFPVHDPCAVVALIR